MYPEPQRAFVDVNEVSEHLCGRNRPGHFRGVATVVSKLFHIVQPHFAFFGEKDYQQLTLVRRLVRDLNIPIQVVGVPTARESDGLALSSRNRRLNLRERASSLQSLVGRAAVNRAWRAERRCDQETRPTRLA